jgi:hypothetical protein
MSENAATAAIIKPIARSLPSRMLQRAASASARLPAAVIRR